MSITAKLALPHIVAAQALKHITHNEALRALDAIVQIGVQDRDLAIPPGAPVDGESYIVAASATGAWAGKDNLIAAWQENAWMFYTPQEGWLAWVADEGQLCVWSGVVWKNVSDSDLQNIAMLGVNTMADTTNKFSVSSTATLFNHEGAGHQVKLNKNGVLDTVSFLYQTGFSGRAEIGLTGDDDFHFKVSPDGTSWKDALIIDGSSGLTSFPSTPLDNNLLINGNFDIWQRGTSFTGLANGYIADRWVIAGVGQFDVSKQNFTLGQTDVPGSPMFHMRLLRSVSGDHNFIQRIENPSAYSDQNVTLSFWARASANVDIDAYLWCATGGGSPDFMAGASQTNSITTGWQKFTTSWNISSFTGKTINDDSGAWLGPNLSLNNLAVGAWVDFAQVKMEWGGRASEFFKRPEAAELALCLRYFERSDVANGAPLFYGQIFSVSTGEGPVEFLEKRVTPTISFGGIWAVWYGAGNSAISSLNAAETTPKRTTISYGGATGGTAGNAVQVYSTGSSYIEIDAELRSF